MTSKVQDDSYKRYTAGSEVKSWLNYKTRMSYGWYLSCLLTRKGKPTSLAPSELHVEVARIWEELSDLRNKIAHVGFDHDTILSARNPEELKNNMSQLIERLEALMDVQESYTNPWVVPEGWPQTEPEWCKERGRDDE